MNKHLTHFASAFLALVTVACHETDNGPFATADVTSSDGAGGTSSDTSGSGDTGAVGPGADVDSPVTTKPCDSDAACDDGLACTTDLCDATGHCAWTVVTGQCLIGGLCLADGDVSPVSPCEVCAAASPTAWSPRTGACDDGDPCTTDDVCDAGACTAGVAVTCDDQNPCTDDVCVPEVGCRSLARSGDCDDNDACTEGDLCVLGACTGAASSCDDGDACTIDSCAGGICGHASASDGTECSDGDACTSSDVCADGTCAGTSNVVCDDGNACTIDYCMKDSGCGVLPTQSPCCLGTANVCDDGDSCTVDSCDPDTADCSYLAVTSGPCDDGQPCTGPDTCSDQGCDGPPVVCDDGSPCTTEACIPDQGCKSFPANEGGACDDGLACSTGDHCESGLCAANVADCACPAPVGDVAKISAAQIGTVVKAGTALDLDNNPATCSPTGSCSGGVHNSFSVLAGLANTALADAFKKGSVILLFGMPAGLPSTFDLIMYQGGLAPDASGCDVATQTCNYWAGSSSFDDQCSPKFTLPAVLTGTQLVAGSATSQIPFSIPFQGASLDVVVYAARLEATLTISGGQVTGFTGILGGAVTKTALFTAVDGLPADALPVPKDAVKAILETSIQYDIDTNNDGTGDAASIALSVEAIDGVITGVSP